MGTSLVDFKEIENEEWSGLESLPIYLEVSNLGRVRKCISFNAYKEIIPSVVKGVKVIYNKGHALQVHRLVAEAFVPKPAEFVVGKRLVVTFKDGNKLDCSAKNLVWGTGSNYTGRNYSVESKEIIYCESLDIAFTTMRSVAYYFRLPQDIVAQCIADHKDIAGLSFKLTPLEEFQSTENTRFVYIGFKDMLQLVDSASSIEELDVLLQEGDFNVTLNIPAPEQSEK